MVRFQDSILLYTYNTLAKGRDTLPYIWDISFLSVGTPVGVVSLTF